MSTSAPMWSNPRSSGMGVKRIGIVPRKLMPLQLVHRVSLMLSRLKRWFHQVDRTRPCRIVDGRWHRLIGCWLSKSRCHSIRRSLEEKFRGWIIVLIVRHLLFGVCSRVFVLVFEILLVSVLAIAIILFLSGLLLLKEIALACVLNLTVEREVVHVWRDDRRLDGWFHYRPGGLFGRLHVLDR
jgi:hypothetical protein